MNIPILTTRAQTEKFVADQIAFSREAYPQDFTRTFTATHNQAGTAQLSLGDKNVTILGYNIQYQMPPDGTEPLWIRFSEQDGQRSWSNNLVPIRSISTPGAIVAGAPGIRYGERPWNRTTRPNEKIAIDWRNTHATADLEITVTFRAIVWPTEIK